MSNFSHTAFVLKLVGQLTHKFSLGDQKLFADVVHGININMQIFNMVLQGHVSSSHHLQQSLA